MQLNVLERLALLEVVPKEGDFITLKLVRKLREALSFSESEISQIDFNMNWKCPKCQREQSAVSAPKCECGSYMTTSGSMTWDAEKGEKVLKEIHMGEKMMSMCVDALKKLDTDKKLTENFVSLFEKVIKTAEEEAE
ncbi:MAG: hypothetical protein MUO99_01895 [Dehalococcoidales bacterium]|nr:hypothetical protein [Dehalococcoidales bacterium]